MNRVLGICDLHDEPHLGRLTDETPLATVTIMGRYGIMDFALSNFSNSGINKICVLVEKNMQSIRNHIGDGQTWIANTKTGFQRILFNEAGVPSPKFNTDVNNLLANRQYIDDISFDYVIIAPVFYLYNCDYREVIAAHKKSGKKITAIYKKINNANEEFLNCETIKIDKNNLVSGFRRNPGTNKEENIFLESFVVDRDEFFRILDRSRSVSAIYSFRRLVSYFIENEGLEVNAYAFKDYVLPILTMKGFFKNSLKLLDNNESSKLLLKDWPILTTAHSTPPCLYGPEAKVKHIYVANGSIINGTVENSILSRDVIVKNGAVVKNCILFTKCTIGEGVVIENLICDKTSKVVEAKELKGEIDDPLYVHYGAKI